MSAPRAKRQFAGAASDPGQRQITNFFQPSTFAPSVPPSSSTEPQSDNAVSLPARVQAGLLSVGMRVRKSVPEGYKTGSYSAFQQSPTPYPTPASTYAATATTATTAAAAATMGEGQRSRANAFSSPRELLPFCGIHKVGNMDTQLEDDGRRSLYSLDMTNNTPNSSLSLATSSFYQPTFGIDEGDESYDDMPGLTNTQETIGSDGPSSPTGLSRKRTFVAYEGGVQDASSKRTNIWCRDQQHFLPAVGGFNDSSSVNGNGRPIAVPRKVRRRSVPLPLAPPTGFGTLQEDNDVKVFGGGDFEEAEFLDRDGWEVDMSDV